MRRKKKVIDPRQMILPFPFPDSHCTVVPVKPLHIEDPYFRPKGYPLHPFKRRKKQ